MPVKIITDSSCDIPREEADRLGIAIVPLSVSFGDEHFLDGVDLSSQEFFYKLSACSQLPVSSQPNPSQFEEAFREHLAEGHDIVCITLSSGLSGTYQSATIAKNAIGAGNIIIVDSQLTSLGLGSLVFDAVELAQQGKSAEEIAAYVHGAKKRISVCVAIDSLKYVVMGGRLSLISGAVGSLLGVKPIVEIKDGLIKRLKKERSMKRAADSLIELCVTRGADIAKTVFVLHSDCEQLGIEFMDSVRKRINGVKLRLFGVGATIGTHAGPGCIGIVFSCSAD